MAGTVATHPNRSKTNIRAGANPTPAQVRAGRERARLSRDQAGELVYSSERGWQNWELELDATEHRRMHPATWELFLAKVGVMEMIAKGELTPAHARELGIYLPAWALEHARKVWG